MLTDRGKIWSGSDSHRDAKKLNRLLPALNRATAEIRQMERVRQPDIDEVLDELLPDLTEALNSEKAFVALLKEDGSEGQKWFELTAVYPRTDLRGHRLEWSTRVMRQLVEDGKPKVVASLGEETQNPIQGLEVLNARSVVLVRMEVMNYLRVVGVCNELDPNASIYLSADGQILDNIVELVAIGARIGEKRRRELEGIQSTSKSISAELDPDVLLPMIAKIAAETFSAAATSLMLWDDSGNRLIIRAKWGLSDTYAQQQSIPREDVWAAVDRDDDIHPLVTPDLQCQPFGNIDLIKQEGLRTVLNAPLLVRERLIGVLNIYSKNEPRQFTTYEQELARVFASQAAIAIRNAEQYEKLEKSQQQNKALHEAGAAITKAGVEPEVVLQTILEQAVNVTGASFGTIQLLQQNALRFMAAWPARRLEWLKRVVGNLPLDGPGITVRTVNLNDAQLVPDVTQDPDFIDATGETGSELAVVLRHGGHREGHPIGVLNVEHRERGGLDSEDRDLLVGLANLAAVTLQNTEQAEQLSRTTAVALMGAWGADIAHDVNREVGAIRRAVFSLQQRNDLSSEVRQRLQEVEDSAGRLALPELPDQFPGMGQKLELRNAPCLDEVIRSEVENLQRAYPDVTLQLEPSCSEVRVAMHEQWLRRLLRHLVKNAASAVSNGKENALVTVRTTIQSAGQASGKETMAKVLVEDRGRGVRPEIETRLFRRPISHTGNRADERQGRGLLLVRYVVELHGGQVWLDWNQPGKGARFAFCIPVV